MVSYNYLYIEQVKPNPFTGCALVFDSARLVASFGHKARTVKVFMAEGYCVKCKAKREIADWRRGDDEERAQGDQGQVPDLRHGHVQDFGRQGRSGQPRPTATPANPPTS